MCKEVVGEQYFHTFKEQQSVMKLSSETLETTPLLFVLSDKTVHGKLCKQQCFHVFYITCVSRWKLFTSV